MPWCNRSSWKSEIGEKGGAVFGAKHERGKYDHRKAQRGQNAWGGGGRRHVDTEARDFQGESIAARLKRYRSGKARETPSQEPLD